MSTIFIINHIERYPAFFAGGTQQTPSSDDAAFADETQQMLSRAHADIHVLVARRLCVNLVEEAQTLADMSETVVLLEEGVRQFGDLISNLFARLIYFLHVLAGQLADLGREQKNP
ncbi:MAG TPA: hypothetical protein PLL41_10905 [Smithella sp.]|nr:hypothetical protein [Smithella sp.]